MAFTVESGTGSSDANSYASVAYAESYFKDSGRFAWPISLAGSWSVSTGGVLSSTDINPIAYGAQVGNKILIETSTNTGTWTISALTSASMTVTESIMSTSTAVLPIWFLTSAAYFSGVGITNQIERKLVQATQWIDGTYASEFPGIRYSTGQSLEWPRDGALSAAGQVIDNDTLPEELKRATCEVAYLLGTGTTLNEVSEAGLSQYSVTVGPISETKEFRGGSEKKKQYDVIRNVIYNVLKFVGLRRVTL